MGLKKGVERTLNTVSEVIQKVKDAVLQQFGEYVVPKAYFVSSELRSQVLSLSKSFQSAYVLGVFVLEYCMQEFHMQ